MKIAYLISAYKDPRQLERLCRSIIFDDGKDFAKAFIHIDKKVNATPFINKLKELHGVTFIPNEKRVFVNWGGYSQVIYQKNMLEVALMASDNFDRFVCISATDYPVWSNYEILEFYKKNPDIQLCGGFDISLSKSQGSIFRVKYWHYFRDLEIPRKYRRLFSYGSRTILKIFGFKRPLMFKDEFGKNCHIYTGSDYWSLTRDCAQYVFDRLSPKSSYVKRLKYTFVPSEIIINTIIHNSFFADKAVPRVISDEYPKLERLTPLHLIEYDKSIRIWKEEDFNLIISSGKMFIRKVSSGISDSLMDSIDKYRICDI